MSQLTIIPSQYLKLHGTSRKHLLRSNFGLTALLISKLCHLQNQVWGQVYSQYGDTLPNQDTTVHSQSGNLFLL